MNGGEGEIRTLVTVLVLTRFRVVRLQPLGHLSARIETAKGTGVLARRGFERLAPKTRRETF